MPHARLAALAAAIGCGISLLAQPPLPSSALPRLVVEAGEVARTNAWVTVPLPSHVRGADLQLRDELLALSSVTTN